MAVDPMIARGVQAPDFANARIAAEDIKNRRQYNALAQQRIGMEQQQYGDEQAAAEQAQRRTDAVAKLKFLYEPVKRGDQRAIQAAAQTISDISPDAFKELMADPANLDPKNFGPALGRMLGIQEPAPLTKPTIEQEGGYSYMWGDKGVVPGSVQAPQRAPLPRPSSAAPAPSSAPTQPKPAPIAYSPKEVSTARAKLTQINVAKRQLANAKAELQAAPSSEVGGPVAGGLATVGVFPKGQEYQAAIDGMRGSITAITRTPGVGAMSDYETRLDQSKFPNFWFDRETTMEQKLQQLEDLLNTMESGYSEIAGASGQSNRVRYDAQGNRL